MMRSKKVEAVAKDTKFMDPVLDWALIYLDQFNRSNEFFIHLNQGPIKHNGTNLNFKKPNFSSIITKLDMGQKENKLSPNHG